MSSLLEPIQKALADRLGLNCPAQVHAPADISDTAVQLSRAWWEALAEGKDVPRRLVFAVGRRDQVESLKLRIEEILPDSESELGRKLRHRAISEGIAAKARKPTPRAAVLVSDSTPRLVNAWKIDPTRPTIIVETQDSLLEDLLFRWSRARARSQVAGLLGQDALWVLDQAHVEEQCAATLAEVHKLQENSLRRIWVWNVGVFAEPDLRVKPLTPPQRYAVLHPKASLKEIATRVCEQARKETPQRIAIFLDKVAEVQTLTNLLRRELGEDVVFAGLTGRYRGHERQQLIAQLKAPFSRGVTPLTTSVLVTNAAGELGIDLEVDMVFCDVVEPNRMNRRFARVTRGTIHVFVAKDAPLVSTISSAPLTEEGHDITDVVFLDDEPSQVDVRILTRPEIDSLSFTNGRTPPDIFGLMRTLNPESTFRIAWRSEANFFLNAFSVARDDEKGMCGEDYEDFLELCPLQSQELVCLPASGQPFKDLQSGVQALLVRHGGTVEHVRDVSTLNALTLGRSILVFPLSEGMLDKDGQFDVDSFDPQDDVFNGRSDESMAGRDNKSPHRLRVLLRPTRNERWKAVALDVLDTFDGLEDVQGETKSEVVKLVMARFEEAGMSLLEHFDYPSLEAAERKATSARETAVLVFGEKRRFFGSLRAGREQTIQEHEAMAEDWAREILGKLSGIPSGVAGTIALAARAHDEGKAHPLWQRSLGEPPKDAEGKPLPGPWAKVAKFPERSRRNRINCGFRHEFASLAMLLAEGVGDDLLLHLVASHHGFCRPGFVESQFDYSANAPGRINIDAMTRFVRVQRRFGWWDLAYFEAILRASDVQASIYQDGIQEEA